MSESSAMAAITKFFLLEEAKRFKEVHQAYLDSLADCCPEGEPLPLPPDYQVESYVPEISFRNIPDEEKRRDFLAMLPKLFLPENDVNDLIEAGRNLLACDPEFRRLVADLGGTVPVCPDEF